MSGGFAFAGSSIKMDLPSSTLKTFSSELSVMPKNSGLSVKVKKYLVEV